MSNDKNLIPERFRQLLTPEQSEDLTNYIKACITYYDGYAYDGDDSSDGIALTMSDDEFDSLHERLEQEMLEAGHQEIVEFLSSGVYRSDTKSLQTQETSNPEVSEMISLKKLKFADEKRRISPVSSVNEIRSFFRQSQYSKDPKIQYIYGPKFDGNAIKVTSENGIPVKIISRGGLNLINLLNKHPQILEAAKNHKTVAGELLIKKSVFKEKYSGTYENPRNFIGSLLKRNDVESSIINDLNFEPYSDGINPVGSCWKPFPIQYKSSLEIAEMLETEFTNFKSDKFPYLCDGIVVGFVTPTREVKENYPLNMLAVKFASTKAKTKVIGFEWSNKKSGNLWPILLIEATYLDGSTCSQCSGYNYEYLKTNHIGIGSEILISKSGDIIPICVKVLTRSENIVMPTVDYYVSGKHLKAIDDTNSKIYKFILGLKLMQIEGIGPELASKIGSVVDYDIIKLFDKEYKPKVCEVLGGGKTWDKFQTFYATKNIYLDLLIEILQFDRVGKTLSNKFAKLLTKQTVDTKGVEKEVLMYVCKGDGLKLIKTSMESLAKLGIKVLPPIEIDDSAITYEMSGDVPANIAKSKDEFSAKIKEIYPNSIHTSLTKTTKLLVVDSLSSSSSKTNKARKANIPIVTYEQFLKKQI